MMLVALAASSQIAGAAEVRIIPGEIIYLNATNPGRNYSDLVIHSVVIATGPGEAFAVNGMRIDLFSKGVAVLSKNISPQALVGETRGLGQMVAQGMGVFLNAQVLSADGLAGLFGRELNLAGSAAMGENEALMLTRQHFSLDFVPDELKVTVYGEPGSGKSETLSARVDVAIHKSPIAYSAPLSGMWLMTSLPSIQSHHRLNPPTEFARDFFKTDAEGRIKDGDALKAENYYGYGEPVMAAADGEVVFVIADEVQDRAAYLPKSGETPRQTGNRIGRHNMRRYAEDFARAAAGNIVVIRHEQEGVIEYSSYGHLKAGSVRVSVGDLVDRGEKIAEVGDTGDSAAVHLHFQVNAGKNVFMSKSLPALLGDLKPPMRGIDPGRFMQKSE